MSSSTAFPGTAADIAIGGVAWTNVNNIEATDAVYATCAVTSANNDTDDITAENYGFATSGTINGVVASLIGHVTNVTRVYDVAQVFLKGGSTSGTNYAPNGGGSGPTTGAWATTDSTLTFGTSTTLSGMTLAPSDVNGSGFGFLFSSSTNAGNLTFSLDSVPITVYYTAAGPFAPPLFPPGAMGLGASPAGGMTNQMRRSRVEGTRFRYVSQKLRSTTRRILRKLRRLGARPFHIDSDRKAA